MPLTVHGLPGLAEPLRLLEVWEQKANPGYLQDALLGYCGFLKDGPSLVADDFNTHVFWGKPGWRMNHAN